MFIFKEKILHKSTLLSVMVLAGCSNLPIAPDSAATTAASPAEQSATETPAQNQPQRPHIELTKDILYKLLVAEVAGQRGQLDVAVREYLDLARSTRDPEIVSRATRIAVYAQDDAAAEEAAKIWVELEPDNTDPHQVLAVMAIRRGDLDTALKHFEKILDTPDGLLDQKLWVIANLLGKEKDQAVVSEVMEKLMKGHENDPDALYAYAHVLSRLGNDEKSLEVLEKVIKLVPDNANAALSYVSVLQKLDKGPQAIDWLHKSLDKYTDNFNLRMFYARLLTDQQRYDDARQQFELLATQAPNNVEVLYSLGLLYLQANRLDEAQTYFKRMTELPDYPDDANYYLGRIAEEKGNLDMASTWYQSLQQGANYFDAQIRLATIIAKQGNIKEAREHLHNIKAENDDQKVLLVQAEAEMLTDVKQYDDAMAVLDKALAKGPNTDLLYSRAMLAEKMDRLDILERDLKEIIAKNPQHVQALNALGYTLADKTNRYQEAYGLIKKAHDLSPNDFYILDSMGWVLYRMGKLDESIKYLHEALDARQDPEIAAHLGEVLWVKGDKTEARKIWEAALQSTPNDSMLLDVIKRFNP